MRHLDAIATSWFCKRLSPQYSYERIHRGRLYLALYGHEKKVLIVGREVPESSSIGFFCVMMWCIDYYWLSFDISTLFGQQMKCLLNNWEYANQKGITLEKKKPPKTNNAYQNPSPL